MASTAPPNTAIVNDMIEVELVGVSLDSASNTPVVVLQELAAPERTLSIFIGTPEATAIAFALEHVEPPRPLTHDLMKNVLDTVEIVLERVVISALRESTFFAELHLSDGESEWVVSSRPSDALALSVRVDCQVFVAEAVLDEAGVAAAADEDFDEGDPEEVVEEFRQFIDSINPDDFAL